jgi:hypothetical protein
MPPSYNEDPVHSCSLISDHDKKNHPPLVPEVVTHLSSLLDISHGALNEQNLPKSVFFFFYLNKLAAMCPSPSRDYFLLR